MSGGPSFGIRHTMSTRLLLMRDVVSALVLSGLRVLRVLEIGAYDGASALVWSAAVGELCGSGSVLCVDPWKAYVCEEDVVSHPICGEINRALESGEVFECFKSNIKFASPGAPIEYLRGSLKDVIWQFATQTFDIIYIDGDHAFDGVVEDILLSRDLLRVGGVLCGDDLERQFHECNLEEVIALRHRNWIGYHPGVTLAVHLFFPTIWVENGFWAMRKVVDGWESFR